MSPSQLRQLDQGQVCLMFSVANWENSAWPSPALVCRPRKGSPPSRAVAHSRRRPSQSRSSTSISTKLHLSTCLGPTHGASNGVSDGIPNLDVGDEACKFRWPHTSLPFPPTPVLPLFRCSSVSSAALPPPPSASSVTSVRDFSGAGLTRLGRGSGDPDFNSTRRPALLARFRGPDKRERRGR